MTEEVSAVDTSTSEAESSPRKRSEVRQRTELVAVRLLPGEREVLKAAANDRNVSMSELIRVSALEAARG
jgi:uncharacterized protein (DUF1778 family)